MTAAAAPVTPVTPRTDAPDVPAADIVTIPDGLPGFERCRRFVVMSSPELEPLARVEGLDDERPSFLALDPRLALPDYDTVLSPADRQRLAVDDHDALLWLAIVRLEDTRLVVNLRAPIVINPRLMIGRQIVPADSPYSTHHELPMD
ncbi:MAG: flagellar assembly protein FliW [Acidobacteriota bacterium]|nr:flagellar assembly protein FliW [Acidobacteriota bacterium]